MKRFMQFKTQPKKLPVVFSGQEVTDLLMATPGPGLKYRAALSISYGAVLRASVLCNLKISDIVPEARLRHDSDRMLTEVDRGSICVFGQGLTGCHFRFSVMSVFATRARFRMTAVIATLKGFPFLRSRSEKALKSVLALMEATAAM